MAREAEEARLAEERRRQEAAAARARETQMQNERQRYMSLIGQAIEDQWYPPSSAREGMNVVLRLTLLPNGELQSVEVVQSSGNQAFDNSAISAARALREYPIPDRRDTFERYFRQFTISFEPEV